MRKRKNFNWGLELIPVPDSVKLPFPENKPKKRYKIYKDGNHFVGTYVLQKKKITTVCEPISEVQRYFDEQYVIAVKQGTKPNKMFLTMKSVIIEQYPDLENIDNFIAENIKRKKHNFYSRLKRFRRKANLNLWNKFVTITYDDKKHDEVSFRTRLKKCLSNLSTRRGWRVMGVFEKGEVGERLHFHAFMYVPQGEMIGEITEQKDYSTKEHKMQITHSNSFFAKTFGRNDFEDLSQNEIKYGNVLDYVTKYLHKSNEKIFYTRGIPSEIFKDINDEDIATKMFDFCSKFVFFDDVIDTEIDVMHFKYHQGNLFDDYYSQFLTS